MNFVETLLISCIPAIVTGIISFCVAESQANSEIKKLKMENEHDLKRLMEQHKVDIEHIQEQHKLELDSKEKDHQHNIEVMQIKHKNELERQEKEQENNVKYAAIGKAMTSIHTGVLGGTLNFPEVQAELSKKLVKGMKKGPNSQN